MYARVGARIIHRARPEKIPVRDGNFAEALRLKEEKRKFAQRW